MSSSSFPLCRQRARQSSPRFTWALPDQNYLCVSPAYTENYVGAGVCQRTFLTGEACTAQVVPIVHGNLLHSLIKFQQIHARKKRQVLRGCAGERHRGSPETGQFIVT